MKEDPLLCNNNQSCLQTFRSFFSEKRPVSTRDGLLAEID